MHSCITIDRCPPRTLAQGTHFLWGRTFTGLSRLALDRSRYLTLIRPVRHPSDQRNTHLTPIGYRTTSSQDSAATLHHSVTSTGVSTHTQQSRRSPLRVESLYLASRAPTTSHCSTNAVATLKPITFTNDYHACTTSTRPSTPPGWVPGWIRKASMASTKATLCRGVLGCSHCLTCVADISASPQTVTVPWCITTMSKKGRRSRSDALVQITTRMEKKP